MATVASDVARVLVHASRDATRREQVDYMLRRRQMVLYAPATAASGTVSESAFFAFDKACVLKKLVVTPLGSVANDATDVTTITIASPDGDWTWDTTTGADGALTATAHVVTLAGSAVTAGDEMLVTITKGGSGKATPVIAVYLDYEEA